jgi:hypothetical protein
MPACPYCNAEIEKNAAACPSCGRHFTVEISGPVQKQGQEKKQHRGEKGPGGRNTIYVSRTGFGCCGTRFLAMACIVGGLWYRQLWVLALLFILLELIAVIQRK